MNYEEIREALGSMRNHLDFHEAATQKQAELQGTENSVRIEVDGLGFYMSGEIADDFLQRTVDHTEDCMEACHYKLRRAMNMPAEVK